MCSVQYQENSNDGAEDVESKNSLIGELSARDKFRSFAGSPKDLRESISSVAHRGSTSFKDPDSSSEEDGDEDGIGFSRLSISDVNIMKNKIAKNVSSSVNELIHSSGILEDSSDSIVNIKRNFQNVIESSGRESDREDIPRVSKGGPVGDNGVSEESIDGDDEGFQMSTLNHSPETNTSSQNVEEIGNVAEVSVDIISLQTSDSEDDEGSSPWYDLRPYLKTNFDVSFLNNLEQRGSRLAKITLPSHSACPHHTSLLLSLTPEVPLGMCHPEALKYRGVSFPQHRNELTALLFKLFNVEIFGARLPPLAIEWCEAATKCSADIATSREIPNRSIELNKIAASDASKLRDSLLHEMCHTANRWIYRRDGGHGPLFEEWVRKIWEKFPEVPKVKAVLD